MINKEKLIKANKILGGRVHNMSNLDFDVDQANHQKNIFKRLATASRSMIAGHAFSDANKRTALVMIKSELADHGIRCDQRKLAKSLVGLAKTNEGNINIIERRIRKACQKSMR